MLDEKLSALMDGELEGSEADQVLARIEHDGEARQAWERMSLIGAAIRREDALQMHAGFAAGVMAQLNDRDHRQEPRTPERSNVVPLKRRWNRSLAGLAVAASVAAAAVLLVEQPSVKEGAEVASTPTATESAAEVAASDNSMRRRVTGDHVHTASAASSSASQSNTVVAADEHSSQSSPSAQGAADSQTASFMSAGFENIAKPGQVFDQDAVRASTPDWSRLIGPNSPQVSYERATASAAWQLQRSIMSGQTTTASKGDADQNLADSIGFLRLQGSSTPINIPPRETVAASH